MTLANLTIRGSSYFPTTSTGGGIFNAGGILTLTGVTVRNNAADHGGGIYNFNGTVTISNSTISNNFGLSGGGINTSRHDHC